MAGCTKWVEKSVKQEVRKIVEDNRKTKDKLVRIKRIPTDISSLDFSKLFKIKSKGNNSFTSPR